MTTATVGGKATASLVNGIETFASEMGEFLVLPTSPTSGVTISPLGRVTIAPVPTVDLRNMFSVAYANYELWYDLVASTATSLLGQLTTGGTPSTASYFGSNANDTASAHANAAAPTTALELCTTAPAAGLSMTGRVQLFGPGLAANSRYSAQTMAQTGASTMTVGHTAGGHNVATGYDCLLLSLNGAGNISGTLWMIAKTNG
jgi:hypothetical protein